MRTDMQVKAFIDFLPVVTSLTSLQLTSDRNFATWRNNKDELMQALWKNRSFTKKIEIDSDMMAELGEVDEIKAYLERILHRNQFMTCLHRLDRIQRMPQSLLPHLFKVLLDTDTTEFFETIRGLHFTKLIDTTNHRS